MLPPHLRSSKRTLTLLSQCHHHPTATRLLLALHARLTVSASISDPFAAGKLISLLALHSSPSLLPHARLLLLHLPSRPTTFIFNTLLRAHVQTLQPLHTLSLYKQMLHASHLPNNYTFSFLLRASLQLQSIHIGRQLHSQALRLGWDFYDFVYNGLIHMYTTSNEIISARKLFDDAHTSDIVAWTAMVNGYVKSGQMDRARELFDRMPERNAVSWSVMITGYQQVGLFKESLDLFGEMQVDGVVPNHAAVVGALSACGGLGALHQGRWIHGFVGRSGVGLELDCQLGTALVDMYAKCGCVGMARQVFDAMPERDVFAYTAMISGLSNHGRSEEAMCLFGEMQERGVRPNEVTFICVISACARMGLTSTGRELFESMDRVYGIKPGVEHYGCLVDLLGRAGLLEEAKKVVSEMPMEPDSYVLGALLNACGVHGEVVMGKEMIESLVDLGLDGSGAHVLMSNMYASARRWEDAFKVRKEMEEKRVKKDPGCSMIEVDGVTFEFVAGDTSHLFMEEILLLLKEMCKHLKTIGNDVHEVESEYGSDQRDAHHNHKSVYLSLTS